MLEQGELVSYGIFEHKHNFSVWAAARATQRGFTNVKNLKEALEQCGIVEFLRKPESYEITYEKFNELHKKWCYSIIQYLNKKGVKNVTFGRAAKLVAVYLKSMVIIGTDSNSSLAKVVHPPIDRILIKNIAKNSEIDSSYKKKWKSVNWTDLNEHEYYTLIEQLSMCLEKNDPLWMLEKFWTVTNK